MVGAWLSSNRKIVCAPNQWINANIFTYDIIPNNWKKLKYKNLMRENYLIINKDSIRNRSIFSELIQNKSLIYFFLKEIY